ncbi:MAG: sterol desaturase family protein [Burkholderiaceae bacterium]
MSLDAALSSSEPMVRAGLFALAFVAMAAWEWLAPRRVPTTPRRARWPSNMAVVVLNTVLVRVLFPLTAVAWADRLARDSDGPMHGLPVPAWLAVVLALVLLDLVIYLQHRVLHAVPWLWRLHRMHHADTEFDVTNGLRFHPLEILLSMLVKFAAIAAIGAPALAVLVFEIMLNATAIFNHANARIPLGLDRVLRWVVVTPDMHRVHHSVLREETDSNFGFNLPWWDRWFGTYRAQPRDGHLGMRIGLFQFRNARWLRLDAMLRQPWASDDAEPPERPDGP